MPIEPVFGESEPENPKAPIWRYVDFWKFEDLVKTGQIYFRRSDKFDDPNEGLPPSEYERVLNLNAFDIKDIRERDHHIGTLAQFRQSYYVNCWHLDMGETAKMWGKYGKDGVAIISRYDLLKQVLHALADKVIIAPVSYGTNHLTRWNVIQFMTTKRTEYASEREVRAMIELNDPFDSMNRHFDEDNRPHDRPIYDPPPTLPEGIRQDIEVDSLITEVVISPFAPPERLEEVRVLLAASKITADVRQSPLTRYSSLIPTNDELKRLMP
jgi:hypothetical protein